MEKISCILNPIPFSKIKLYSTLAKATSFPVNASMQQSCTIESCTTLCDTQHSLYSSIATATTAASATLASVVFPDPPNECAPPLSELLPQLKEAKVGPSCIHDVRVSSPEQLTAQPSCSARMVPLLCWQQPLNLLVKFTLLLFPPHVEKPSPVPWGDWNPFQKQPGALYGSGLGLLQITLEAPLRTRQSGSAKTVSFGAYGVKVLYPDTSTSKVQTRYSALMVIFSCVTFRVSLKVVMVPPEQHCSTAARLLSQSGIEQDASVLLAGGEIASKYEHD